MLYILCFFAAVAVDLSWIVWSREYEARRVLRSSLAAGIWGLTGWIAMVGITYNRYTVIPDVIGIMVGNYIGVVWRVRKERAELQAMLAKEPTFLTNQALRPVKNSML